MSQLKSDILLDTTNSIQYLNSYLTELQENNPGSVVHFQSFNDVFGKACLAPGATTKAFTNLLPVVAVDACHMRTKQGGMIFSATAMTGERMIIPFAIAIASTENEENWTWFLRKLLTSIPEINNPNVYIASDRDKGLLQAQRVVLPLSHSSYLSRASAS